VCFIDSDLSERLSLIIPSNSIEHWAEESQRRSRLGVWKDPNSMKPSEFRKRARDKLAINRKTGVWSGNAE
jgi:hypothetical protein